MYAVEFESDVVNGAVRIPHELQEKHPQHLRLIAFLPEPSGCLPNNQLKHALDFFDQLDVYRLGWGEDKMTREQMNER